MAWNIFTRLGGLDRFLHVISCGWRKPSNGAPARHRRSFDVLSGAKLLREAGYFMGYPRFGAVVALLLARLCMGTPLPFDGPEMILLVLVLLAEVTEDAMSYGLWYLGVNLFPFQHFLTEEEVEVLAASKLRKRTERASSKESTGRQTSKSSAKSAVVPAPVDPPPVLDREEMKSTCWSTRVASR